MLVRFQQAGQNFTYLKNLCYNSVMKYTHKITWFEMHDYLGVLTKSFRTTQDAVGLHVRNLGRSKKVSNITIERIEE